MTTRFATLLLMSTLTTVAWMRSADAQKLVLVEPSGSLAAAVRREMRETAIDLMIVHGDTQSPVRIGIEQDARFVVSREGTAYVMWDGLARTSRRREASDIDDEISATQVARDIREWVVAAGDAAYSSEPSFHETVASGVLERPLYRIDFFVGGRLNVGESHAAAASVGWSAGRRVGPLELGLGVTWIEDQPRWEQSSYLVHVRAPWNAIGGARGTIIPRVSVGAVRATGKSRTTSESGSWLVAEAGVLAEFRSHRLSWAIEVGASFHREQSLADTSITVRAHVESMLLAHVGLLLY